MPLSYIERSGGRVYDAAGNVLGRVYRESKVAAGTKGQRRMFWTARLSINGEEFSGIGTRHKTRASAVRAIRLFHTLNPYASQMYRGAVFAAIERFAYDHWQDCGRSVRNLADPDTLRYRHFV